MTTTTIIFTIDDVRDASAHEAATDIKSALESAGRFAVLGMAAYQNSDSGEESYWQNVTTINRNAVERLLVILPSVARDRTDTFGIAGPMQAVDAAICPECGGSKSEPRAIRNDPQTQTVVTCKRPFHSGGVW